MIISEQWLRTWVSPQVTTDALSHKLTMIGLEVDSIAGAAEAFSGVVVAQIIAAEQHPDADKLRVCTVNAGDETVQIVCGAPNARAGLIAPLAKVGAVLPGDFKIKKAKLRGVESQGMLCAGAELTISEDNDGLMELPADAPIGADIREYLSLDDQVIELGLTPNRADCLSVRGIARDVAVAFDETLNETAIAPVESTIAETFPVAIEATAKCPRYLGRVIKNVDLSRPTPDFMRERLERAGLRSIDAAVDVTNYVLLELGQPLHAFDLDQLNGGIVVRECKPDEVLTLLDGTEQALEPGTLVIADHTQPLALAGIMGGAGSGVSESTTNLFLESAFFTPELMAGRARSYGLHTDASHRYERGVDFQLQREAMERATQLFIDAVGGEAGPVTEVVSDADLPVNEAVLLREAQIEKLLGIKIDRVEVERILEGLGFWVVGHKQGWLCTAPSWRFDMGLEVDLIEELARLIGFDAIPSQPIKASLIPVGVPETRRALRMAKNDLVARGYFEAVTFSFVAPEVQSYFDPELSPIALKNPISADLAVMRTSLIPGLLKAIAHNASRQQSRVKLFETGLKFMSGEGTEQIPMLAIAVSGLRDLEGWSTDKTAADFFDLKGTLEGLLANLGDRLTFEASVFPGLHDGQSAAILVDRKCVGRIGAVHPSVRKAMGIPANTVVAEVLQSVVNEVAMPAYDDISKYPETRRDLALVADKTAASAEVLSTIRKAAGSLLTKLDLFDVYEGAGLAEGKKSLAIGLTFQDQSRTLDESEVSSAVDQVLDSLKEKLGIELRS
ncbi:MAG: phenylalanine--tRNA ligase subunit beta [Halieaceae bacterium MED-G26]|nr:MAG: phenylalanine--tRNA ligase subunit beta [Halieaceae bacterium MED-G26]